LKFEIWNLFLLDDSGFRKGDKEEGRQGKVVSRMDGFAATPLATMSSFIRGRGLSSVVCGQHVLVWFVNSKFVQLSESIFCR